MKKTLLLLAILALPASRLLAQIHLEKRWETDTLLKTPESVLFDPVNKVLYVSNINGDPSAKDGNGSIGKVGLDGKIISVEWVKGLSAPKGMGLHGNMLYVADVDEVVGIDIKTGTILEKTAVPGSAFLNDITVDGSGVVYVSDSKTLKVHRIEAGRVTTIAENLKGPNGLLAVGNDLYLLDKGGLYKLVNGKPEMVAEGMQEDTDGVEMVKPGEFLVSCWGGNIWYVKDYGSKQLLLDTREKKINSADIGYDPVTRMVYVPTFFKNGVIAYELK